MEQALGMVQEASALVGRVGEVVVALRRAAKRATTRPDAAQA
ncbi:MAG: hypothetical protein AB1430_06300 [Pseudomonadota bacterium]